jgi:hypothetical protein
MVLKFVQLPQKSKFFRWIPGPLRLYGRLEDTHHVESHDYLSEKAENPYYRIA